MMGSWAEADSGVAEGAAVEHHCARSPGQRRAPASDSYHVLAPGGPGACLLVSYRPLAAGFPPRAGSP